MTFLQHDIYVYGTIQTSLRHYKAKCGEIKCMWRYLHCNRAQNIPVFLLMVETSEFSTRNCPWAVHSTAGKVSQTGELKAVEGVRGRRTHTAQQSVRNERSLAPTNACDRKLAPGAGINSARRCGKSAHSGLGGGTVCLATLFQENCS